MSFPSLFDVGRGGASGWQSDHKFGRNPAVGTTFAPVTYDGVFMVPQPSGAQRLRVRAGNAADGPEGAGARAVQLYGLDASGNLQMEEIATAGASAGPYSTGSYIRLFRSYVTESGTYGTQTQGSHVGDIVVEDESQNLWLTIAVDGFPRSQSQIAVYSVPLNHELFIMGSVITVQTGKETSVVLYQRRNILDEIAPYNAVRVVEEFMGLTGEFVHHHAFPIGPFPELTDIGFMAKVESQTADVSITFDYLLRRIR